MAALTPQEIDALGAPQPASQPGALPAPSPTRSLDIGFSPQEIDALDTNPARIIPVDRRVNQGPSVAAHIQSMTPLPKPTTGVPAEPISAEDIASGVAQAVRQFPENTGKSAGYLGNIARAVPADVGTIGEFSDFGGNVKAAMADEPLPIDKAMEMARQEDVENGRMPVASMVGKISQGVAKATPKIAMLAAAPEGWFAQAVASGGLFGLDDEGKFHPKDAVIASLFPGVSAVGRKIVGETIGGMLASGKGGAALANPVVQKTLETMGEQAALNAYSTAVQLPDLLRLSKEDPLEFQNQLAEIVGNNLAFGLLGVHKYLKGVPSETQAWISKNADVLSRNVILSQHSGQELADAYQRANSSDPNAASPQDKALAELLDQHAADMKQPFKNGIFVAAKNWISPQLAKAMGTPETYSYPIESALPLPNRGKAGANQLTTGENNANSQQSPVAPTGGTEAGGVSPAPSGEPGEVQKPAGAGGPASAGSAPAPTEKPGNAGTAKPAEAAKPGAKASEPVTPTLDWKKATPGEIGQLPPDQFGRWYQGLKENRKPLQDRLADQMSEVDLHARVVSETEAATQLQHKAAAETDPEKKTALMNDYMAQAQRVQLFSEAQKVKQGKIAKGTITPTGTKPDETATEAPKPETKPEVSATSTPVKGEIDFAQELVQKTKKASVSLLQRSFRWSYAKASAVMTELEKRGVVSAAKADGSREVVAEKPKGETAAPQMPAHIGTVSELRALKLLVADGESKGAKLGGIKQYISDIEAGKFDGQPSLADTIHATHLAIKAQEKKNAANPPAPKPAVTKPERKAGDLADLSDDELKALLDEAQGDGSQDAYEQAVKGTAPKQEEPAKPATKPAPKQPRQPGIRRKSATKQKPAIEIIESRDIRTRRYEGMKDKELVAQGGALRGKMVSYATVGLAGGEKDEILIAPNNGGEAVWAPARSVWTAEDWAKSQQQANKPRERTAAEIAAEAAKLGVNGAGEALKGLHELFGGGTHLGSGGPAFDEETYQKAKPHFEKAYEDFKASGKTLLEFIKFCYAQFSNRVRPYLERFIKDLRAKAQGDTVALDAQQPGQSPSGGGSDAGEVPAASGAPGDGGAAGQSPAGAGAGVQPPASQGAAGQQAGTGNGGGGPNANANGVSDQPGSTPAESDTGGGGNGPTAEVRGEPPPPNPPPAPDVTIDVGANGPTNLRLEDSHAPTGPVARIEANIGAIELVKKLELENRFPTDEERAKLAAWSGWGSFKELFNEGKAERREWDQGWMKRYGRHYDKLRKLLTPQEFNAAAESSVNAHYTGPDVIRPMWDLAKRLGFKGGRVIETSAGSGNFIGFSPDDLAKTMSWTAVEMEPITGKILKYLYPEADVRIQPYENTKIPNGFFDLSIGNFPFHEVGPGKEYPDLNLHNYFFARTLDKLKPGGLIIAITTSNTMEAQSAQRAFLAGKGELVGAIRLPNNAFNKSAGTEVTTDIIVLRKPDGKPFPAEKWTNQVKTDIDGTEYPINEYFISHPEMVLGKHALTGTMYRENSYTVEGSGDLGAKLAEVVKKFPENITQQGDTAEDHAPQATTLEDYSLVVDEKGQVKEAVGFKLQDPKWIAQNGADARKARAKQYIALRDVLLAQYGLENDPAATEQAIEANRKKLKAAYDKYVKGNGTLNDNNARTSYLRTDPGFYTVMALENVKEVADPKDPTKTMTVVEPADVLSKRVNFPDRPPEKVANATDALAVSMSYKGTLDIDLMRKLTGLSDEQIEAELIGANLAFKDPAIGSLVANHEYLSGDVREKLAKAVFAAKESDTFKRNVEALRSVIPDVVPFEKIMAGITARWTPPSVLNLFAREVLGMPGDPVSFVPGTEEFAVTPKRGNIDPRKVAEWRTDKLNPYELLRDALNFKRPEIAEYDDEGKKHIDEKQTDLARSIVKRMEEEYERYIKTSKSTAPYRFFDPDRGEYRTEPLPIWDIMEREFNKRFNSFVDPKFEGTALKLPGLSQAVRRTPHLINGVMRAIMTGSAVFAHGVGSGKAQPLDAKILTPTGWKRMGDIKVGDRVIGSNGMPTEVVGVYPQGVKPVFAVNMSDGAVTRCCEEHLWLTQTQYERDKMVHGRGLGKAWDCATPKVRDLRLIRETIQERHYIPLVRPVEFPAANLPLHPYVLGVLIGDGCLRLSTPSFTNVEQQIVDRVAALLPPDCRLTKRACGHKAQSYGIRGRSRLNPVAEAISGLGLHGLKSEAKFLPTQYLMGSIQQRLDLLQGLMDCDGWNETSCCYCTVSHRLAQDVVNLVNSLGGTARITPRVPSYQHKGEKRHGQTAYTVRMSLPPGMVPFSLNRKVATFRPKTKYLPFRRIESVEACGAEPCQCIKVAAEDQLYVTDDFIVTHNTFLGVVIGHELQRIGLAKKFIHVVKKPTVAQFRTSIERAYPGSKVLIPGENDFTKDNRKRLIARIASGKWDFIILTHEQFKKIRPGEQLVQSFYDEQIEKLRQILRDMGETDAENEKSTRGMEPAVRNIVKKLKSLKKKLSEHIEAIQKNQDNALQWEQLGVDGAFVDESHNFKRLPVATQIENEVKGIPSDFSQRAVDLLIKMRNIQARTQGRNVFFASGTPVSNTLAELWLQFYATNPKLLKDFNVETFDSFATAFADIQDSFELGWDNKFRDVTRMSRFKNPVGLTMLTRNGMDVKIGNKELGLDVPDMDGGKPIIKVVKNTPTFDRWCKLLDDISSGWESLDKKGRFDNSWVPIATMRAGVAAALDPRCVFGPEDDDPNSKVNTAIRDIFKEWQDGQERRTTMMVFADLYRQMNTEKLMGFIGGDTSKEPEVVTSVPEDDEGDESGDTGKKDEAAYEKASVGNFNLYNDIRSKLVSMGVPEHEIAVITEHESDAKRESLFNKVRSGVVRILLGSTEKIGEGVDVPQRMSAQFHLDPPMQMTPAKLEQRIGRIIRQGNLHSPKNWNLPVRVYMYATERSMDASIYDMLQRKGEMVLQALRGQFLGDTFEDPASEFTQSLAEMKAAATGDTRLLEYAKLKKDVRELTQQENAYLQRMSELRRSMADAERTARAAMDNARSYQVIGQAAQAALADKDTVTMLHVSEQKRITGEEAIDEWLKKAQTAMEKATHIAAPTEAVSKFGQSYEKKAVLKLLFGDNLRCEVEAHRWDRYRNDEENKPVMDETRTNITATFYLGGSEPKVGDPRWDSSLSSVANVLAALKRVPANAVERSGSEQKRSAEAMAMAQAYGEQFNKTTFDRAQELQEKRAAMRALEVSLKAPTVTPMQKAVRAFDTETRQVSPPVYVRILNELAQVTDAADKLRQQAMSAQAKATAHKTAGSQALASKAQEIADEADYKAQDMEDRARDLQRRLAIVEKARMAAAMGGKLTGGYGQTPNQRGRQGSIGDVQPAEAQRPTVDVNNLEQLRAAVNAPDSGLEPEAVKLINAFLDSPLAKHLQGLRFRIADMLQGGWQGSYFQKVWEIARNADPKTGPHEFLHRIWEILPEEVQAEFERMRSESLKDMLQEASDQTEQQAIMHLHNNPSLGGEDFLGRGYPQGMLGQLYPYSSAEEFFTHTASDEFKRRVGSMQEGFWARVKRIIGDFISAVKKALGLKQSQKDWLSNILTGNFKPAEAEDMAGAEREAQASLPAEGATAPAAEGGADEPDVPTEVFGVTDHVRNRVVSTPSTRADAVAYAKNIFDQAKVPVSLIPGSAPGTGVWKIEPSGFDMEAEGHRLLDLVKKAIEQDNNANNGELLSSLLNTLVMNFKQGWMTEFSRPLREDLYAAAQSERSHRGMALGALGMSKPDMEFVGQNVDVVLYQNMSKAFGGDAIRSVLDRIREIIRKDLSAGQPTGSIAVTPELQAAFQQILEDWHKDQGGRVYRKAQAMLKPKSAKTLAKLEADARIEEAVNQIIENAKLLGIEPKKSPNKKLSPLHALLLMVTPGTSEKINDLIERAVAQGERNAGMKQMLREATTPEEREDLQTRFAAGEDPDPEAIEKGLETPEYAHWKALRDNLLGYDPTTLKLAQDLVRSDFKGTRFGRPEQRPADTRLNLDKLATQPEAEVKRVMDAYLDNLEANMDVRGADEDTQERIRGMIEREVAHQIEQARERYRAPMFKEPPKPGEQLTPEQRIGKLLNAKLFTDTRFDLPGMVKKVAGQSRITRLTPNLNDLIKQVFDTPFYRQDELPQRFAELLKNKLGIQPDQEARAKEVFAQAFKDRFEKARGKALQQAVESFTPVERKLFLGRPLWKKVVRAVNAGMLDSGTVLREIARARGWPEPTDAFVRRFRDLAEEVQRLSDLTPAELAAAGSNPNAVARARADKEALTRSKRIATLKKMGVMWARMTRPISAWNWLSTRKNIAQAAQEYGIANVLLKPGFMFFRIEAHLAGQLFFHSVTEPIGAAIERHLITKQQGRPTNIAREVAASFRDQWGMLLRSLGPSLRAARAAALGRDVRTLDHLMDGVKAIERMVDSANDHFAKGDYVRATLIHLVALPRVSLKVLAAVDAWQGAMNEQAEIAHEIRAQLEEQGKSPAEVAHFMDSWKQRIKAETITARADAANMLRTMGLPANWAQVNETADRLVKSRAMQWLQEQGLRTIDIAERVESVMRREAWQQPVKHGLGGVVASAARGAQAFAHEMGVPLPITNFANAIGTGINYLIRFTPFYWSNRLGRGPAPWWETPRDRWQSHALAAMAAMAGGALFLLAAAGLWNVVMPKKRSKEENDLLIAGGHKIGTVEIPTGTPGHFVPVSLSVGPLSFFAPYLVAGGAAHDLAVKREQQQAKLNAEAEARGLQPGKLPPLTVAERLAVVGEAAWAALQVNKAMAGLTGSMTEFSIPNAQKALASQASPYIPGLPAYQEVTRMVGIQMDKDLATFSDWLFPTASSQARMVNVLGDPVKTPDDLQRIIQTVTAGSYPGVVDGDQMKGSSAYAALMGSGANIPAISPEKGHAFGDQFRPMTDAELAQYAENRGKFLKDQLAGLGPEATKQEVGKAYLEADRQALESVGVDTTSKPMPTARAAAGSMTAQQPGVAPTPGQAGLPGARGASGVKGRPAGFRRVSGGIRGGRGGGGLRRPPVSGVHRTPGVRRTPGIRLSRGAGGAPMPRGSGAPRRSAGFRRR